MSFGTILYTLILYPLIQLIEISFKLFDKIFDNTGIAILGVSFTVTLFCLPLYIVAEKWQQIERDTQTKLKSGIDRIKQTFKGDEQYMILSTFYKQNHYHPMMALRSSFGLLIQVPFFMAAYSCLSHLQGLQGQSFLFIRDMGQQDALFHIGNFPVNVLPIAMTLINIIAGAIYTKGFAIKEKIQIYGMALLFLVVLYNSPSGLVLYWTMNNVFSLVKNVFYKLKNPAKTLYICAASCCVAGIIFFTFVYTTKTTNKLIALLFFALILAIPFYVKAFSKLLNTKLSYFVNNSKARTSVFLSSCLLMIILTSITIPSSLIGSSPTEFCGIAGNISPYFIFRTIFVQSLGIYFFWALCIYFLFGKRIQTLMAFIMSFIALSSVANVFIFQGNYGDISQTLTFLNVTNFASFGTKSLINIVFTILLFTMLCLFATKKEVKPLTYIINLLSLALFVSAIPNFSYINKEIKNYTTNANNESVSKISPIFTLSRNNKNVILLFLDRAQTRFVSEMLKEDNSLNKSFYGFVNYPQVLSYNGHTLMGAPGMFGGYEYIPYEINKRDTEPLVKKNNEALLMLPRVFNEQLNYSAVITDPSWANYNTFTDISIVNDYPNIKGYKTKDSYNDLWYKTHPESDFASNTEKLIKRNMLYFAIFRQAPVFLREFIYYKGTYWSTDENINDFSDLIGSYAPLTFLTELTEIKETETGTYTGITNELTHASEFLQAPDYIPVKVVTNYGTSKYATNNNAYHTQMAAFKMIAKWFNYMQENGVYDNTRIVIVSDHGASQYEEEFEADPELDEKVASTKYKGRGHYHCILMFKDFNAKGDIKTDNTFMTNADTASLLLKDYGKDFTNPFTGNKIPLDTKKFKQNGIYITTSDAHQPLYNGKYQFSIKDTEWWHVKENIFESKNWTQEAPND